MPWAAYACLTASMALVGGYVALSKVLVAALPVFLLAWLRFGIAAAAMPHWLRRPPDEARLTASERRLLFLESFLGNFLFSICMLYGVALTSAVSAGVVLAAIPAAVALLSRWMLGERIHRRTAWAIALAVVGIGLLALARGTDGPQGDTAPTHSGMGHLLLVGAVFCEAFYVVAGKRLSAKLSPRRISALINLWGLALMTPLGLWQASRFDFSAVPAPVWLLLVFYAVAASVVAVWLWMRGMAQVPASRAGVFSVLLPLTAAGVGIGLLGEPFGMAHGVAMALAVSGLLLATWPASDAGAAPALPRDQPPSAPQLPRQPG